MANLPGPNQVEQFLRVTKSYDVKNTMDGVTNYADQFREIKTKIAEFGQKQQAQSEETPLKFQSKDEMIKVVMDFYRQLDSSIASKIESVLNDYMVTKDITLEKEGPSTGKTTPEGTRLHLELNVKPDATGLVAMAQEFANVYVYSKYFEKQKQEEEQKMQFIKNAANKFMGHMMIDFLVNEFHLPPEQAQFMHNESLRDLSRDIVSLEQDQVIFSKMYDTNPAAFANNLENYTPENFYTAMERWKDQPQTMEIVNERIKEIGEKGQTQYYLMGSVVSQLSALQLRENYYGQEGKKVAVQLFDAIDNQQKLSEVTGMTNADLINQGGNLVKESMDLDKQRELEGDEYEKVLVMEKQRIKPTY